MKTVERDNTEKSGKRKRTAVIIVLLCVTAALAVLCAVMFFTGDSGGMTMYQYQLDGNLTESIERKTAEELQEEVDEKVAEGMMNISINLSPVFENGGECGDLNIVNSEKNRYSQTVEIFLDDTGECIYRSGLVPVGMCIQNASLDTELEPGMYRATAYFHQIDENGNETGTAGAEMMITVY